jgi:hypothetical protein
MLPVAGIKDVLNPICETTERRTNEARVRQWTNLLKEQCKNQYN